MPPRKYKMCEIIDSFDREEFLRLCDRLEEKKSTLILYHVHPDADAIGSAFALRRLLQMTGSCAVCLCEDKIPKRLEFLVQGEQTNEIPTEFVAERIISTDVASPSQIGGLFEKYKVDIMIDHHAKGTPFASLNYVRPSAAAASEIIFDISREFLRRGLIDEIPEDVERLLYAGISSDTGCFRFSNVTAGTHMRAAELVKSRIDTADINHRLFEAKSVKQLEAEQAGFRRLKLHCGGRVATVSFPHELKESLGLEGEHLETLVDVARNVEGVEVAAVIRQQVKRLDEGDGHGCEKAYRVSMRSSCDFDVSRVCADFGGGGHVRAAGCSVRAEDIEQAEQKIVDAIIARLCE